MKKMSIGLLFTLISWSAFSQTLQPVEVKTGKLTLSVDPRMELLSTVQVLSNYPHIDRSSVYSKEIQEYFKSFSGQPAVAFTDTLYNLGFGYDAPVAFMLQLSNVPELQLTDSNPEFGYISGRAGGTKNVSTYRDALQKFVSKSSFSKFWKEKTDLYRQIIDTTVADLQRGDLVELMEKYYNESQHSYTIILSPLFASNNYGPRLTRPDGKSDIFSCNGLTQDKNGIPYLPYNQTTYLAWHEFSHSFVNPNSDRNNEKIMSYAPLFEPVREIMHRMAYDNWKTCVNEHIVRAVVIRLSELNLGKEAAESRIQWELKRNFIYIKPILEKLKEFEEKRDKEGITFSTYYPELLDVFEGIKPHEYSFQGPVNNVYSSSSKLAMIYPTSITDSTERNDIQKYVNQIFEFIKPRLDPLNIELIADTTALSKPLADYALMAYGTMESNLFLAHYKTLFPFSFENGKLKADKEYAGPDIKLISCVPNPQNPKRGLNIYTASSNRDIIGINRMPHGLEDYVIFTGKDTLLKNGHYDKNEKWTF